MVNVSWYEAEAYCRWLSSLQRRFELRLPREEERLAAATAAVGKFPWGAAEPDGERANFAVQVGSPSPVGAYPLGVGPYGHADLSGNVWEWCADVLRGEREHPSTEARPLHGGAWRSPADALWSTSRKRSEPGNRDSFVGFRLCAAQRRD